MQFSILSECRIHADVEAEEAFYKAARQDRQYEFGREILEALAAKLDEKPLVENIEDSLPKFVAFQVRARGHRFVVQYNYRRLGVDEGTDTIVYLDNHVKMALGHINAVLQTAS